MKITSEIKNYYAKVPKALKACSETIGGASYVLKVALSILDLTEEALDPVPGAQGIVAGIRATKTVGKGAVFVFKWTNIFERGRDWGTAKGRADLFKSWPKAVSRALLTVSQGMDFVICSDKVTLGFFGRAALRVGELPVIEAVTGGFVIASAVFGIGHASREVYRARRERRIGSERVKKWTGCQGLLAGLDKSDKNAVLLRYSEKIVADRKKKAAATAARQKAEFALSAAESASKAKKVTRAQRRVDVAEAAEARYQKKIIQKNLYIGMLENDQEKHSVQVANFQAAKVGRIRRKLKMKLINIGKTSELLKADFDANEVILKANKEQLRGLWFWQGRAKHLKKANQALNKQLADQQKALLKVRRLENSIGLIRADKVGKLLKYKVEKNEARVHDGKVNSVKNWVAIAANVAKIAGVIVGMLSVALAVVFPWLALPAVVLALSGFSICTYGMGLVKFLVDAKGVGPTLDTRSFVVVPAA